MAIEPKTTREHILSLYGHISGVKKNLKHVHEDVEKLGGKIDKVYWVLLAAAGTAAPVSYTHLRAHETVLDLVCRLLLEKKKLH